MVENQYPGLAVSEVSDDNLRPDLVLQALINAISVLNYQDKVALAQAWEKAMKKTDLKDTTPPNGWGPVQHYQYTS